MEYDPILKEVHAAKEKLAREANFDARALCHRFREAEKRYASRIVDMATVKPKEDAEKPSL